MDMTIYGQKIIFDRDSESYTVLSTTPNYMSDISFSANQINSAKIQLMSSKLSQIENIVNQEE